MGNAISSLIGHNGAEVDDDGEENVLLSEEHSLVLTCCWVTLKVQAFTVMTTDQGSHCLFL